MKIAYFSPLPPKRTGIAAYSEHLIHEFKKLAEIELFHEGKSDLIGLPIHDYVMSPSSLAKLTNFDVCIYHIGNNPFFHSSIRDVLIHKPGLVVLHDAVLYFLVAGRGKGALLRELQASTSNPFSTLEQSFSTIDEVSQNDLLKFEKPELLPLLTSVLNHAKMVLVHSNAALDAVLKAGYTKEVRLIPPSIYPNVLNESRKVNLNETRSSLGVKSDDFLIGSFGFIGPTKRVKNLLLAVRKLSKENNSVKLLVVGVGDEITELIQKYGIGHHVIVAGFVSDSQFQLLFSAVDAVVNLRFPSAGEASGTLLHAFTHAKPCLVTNIAWFAELPDEVVKKISHEESEVEEIVEALSHWIQKPHEAKEMGRAAFAYSKIEMDPKRVARLYFEACEELLDYE